MYQSEMNAVSSFAICQALADVKQIGQTYSLQELITKSRENPVQSR